MFYITLQIVIPGIGNFNHHDQIRCTCVPGKHLIASKSENNAINLISFISSSCKKVALIMDGRMCKNFVSSCQDLFPLFPLVLKWYNIL